jgi:hypothetical protein
MDAKVLEVKIQPEGGIRFIYDDELTGLLALGCPTIKRASHVEPDALGRWTADMSPANGPVLGPFIKRADALMAERAWLERNGYGSLFDFSSDADRHRADEPDGKL